MDDFRKFERTNDIRALMGMLGVERKDLSAHLSIDAGRLERMLDSGLTLDEFIMIVRALGEMRGPY